MYTHARGKPSGLRCFMRFCTRYSDDKGLEKKRLRSTFLSDETIGQCFSRVEFDLYKSSKGGGGGQRKKRRAI